MKRRVLLTVSYDGTAYSGWQKQPQENVKTVQGELDKACTAFFKNKTESIGASRTDAGVHALGQRAVIDIESTIPTERIPLALNGALPEDIVITGAADVPDGFNPRFKAVKKTYEYIENANINTTGDTIHFLPFWDNGVKFFTIEGPNREKIEFSQYL